jgi:hypothetical protein
MKIENIISTFAIPILILNLLGGIVSGVWLAILHDWNPIIIGVSVFILSTFLISIVLMPSMIFIVPAGICIKNRNIFGALFWGALNNIYTIGIITLWCCGVLFTFMKDASGSNFLPRLIWSYGIATGPWAYLASKENDNFASSNGTFMAELAYIVVMIIIIFNGIEPIQAIKIFSGFMIFSFILNMIIAYFLQKEEFDKENYYAHTDNDIEENEDKNDQSISNLSEDDIYELLKNGINCFKNSEYANALLKFENVIQNDPQNKIAPVQ